jgi:hypothetical protein
LDRIYLDECPCRHRKLRPDLASRSLCCHTSGTQNCRRKIFWEESILVSLEVHDIRRSKSARYNCCILILWACALPRSSDNQLAENTPIEPNCADHSHMQGVRRSLTCSYALQRLGIPCKNAVCCQVSPASKDPRQATSSYSLHKMFERLAELHTTTASCHHIPNRSLRQVWHGCKYEMHCLLRRIAYRITGA